MKLPNCCKYSVDVVPGAILSIPASATRPRPVPPSLACMGFPVPVIAGTDHTASKSLRVGTGANFSGIGAMDAFFKK